MDKSIIETYLNQRIKIFLKNGFYYEGEIERIGNDSLLFKDKNNADIAINFDEISTIKNIKLEEEDKDG